jgi:hypothetical protein
MKKKRSGFVSGPPSGGAAPSSSRADEDELPVLTPLYGTPSAPAASAASAGGRTAAPPVSFRASTAGGGAAGGSAARAAFASAKAAGETTPGTADPRATTARACPAACARPRYAASGGRPSLRLPAAPFGADANRSFGLSPLSPHSSSSDSFLPHRSAPASVPTAGTNSDDDDMPHLLSLSANSGASSASSAKGGRPASKSDEAATRNLPLPGLQTLPGESIFAHTKGSKKCVSRAPFSARATFPRLTRSPPSTERLSPRRRRSSSSDSTGSAQRPSRRRRRRPSSAFSCA